MKTCASRIGFFLIVSLLFQSALSQGQHVVPDEDQHWTECLLQESALPATSMPVVYSPLTETTVTALPYNGGISQNCKAPNNSWKYQRAEYLITPAEMSACGFPSGQNIRSIGFLVNTAGIEAITGSLNIYLKNTSDATYLLGSSWTTSGFTLVSANSSYVIQISNNAFYIIFSGGSSFTYTGGGLYVAWEFSAPSATFTNANIAVTHACNYTSAFYLYGQRNNTSLPTALTGSSFRPVTILSTSQTFSDAVNVTNIYTLGKVPVPFGVPAGIGVRVINPSASAATFDLTIEVKNLATSTLRYTSTQTGVSVAANSASIFTFSGWSPSVTEDVSITATASAPTGETWTLNNSLYVYSKVNSVTFSHAYGTPLVNTSFGITYPGAGIFATKYTMNGPGMVTGAKILIGSSTSAVGNTVSAVVLNSAGTIVATSAGSVILSTDLDTLKEFTFSTPPSFTNEPFYAGLLTTAGTAQYYPVGCPYDIPQRENTFYTFGSTGGTPALFNTTYQLDIEPVVSVISGQNHDVGMFALNPVQVYPAGTLNPTATVKNYGDATETFPVTMTIGTYSSQKTVTALAPGATQTVTFDPWSAAVGDYTMTACTQLTGDANSSNNCLSQTVKVLQMNRQVYGYNANPGSGSDPAGPASFYLSAPGTLSSIANQSALPNLIGGTWASGQWYSMAYSFLAPWPFLKVNPTTGARTEVGNMGVRINEISYNKVTGYMYGVSQTNLYRINLTTGQTTLVGANSGIYLASLAISSTGQCYAVDVFADKLGTINLTTGAFTPIGPIGFDAGYNQDMEFDRETGNLYMISFGTQCEFRWVNTTTGNTMLIGTFEGNAEVTALAIPYDVAVAPTVTTAAVTNVTQTAASSGGTVTSDGGATVTERGICWSLSPNPTIAGAHSASGAGTGSFTSSLTGLTPCTTYYARAYATNAAGTGYGGEVAFCTFCIVTAPVTSITASTAVSGGNITCGGSSVITERGVCWSTNPLPTTADPKTGNGSGIGVFTSSLTGLQPSTAYHVRAYAVSQDGTFYGEDNLFQTVSGLPTVITNEVTGVTDSSATLGGTVTSTGSSPVIQRGVCWSTLPSPTITDSLSIDGAGIGSFFSNPDGLSEYTFYYLRAYATNSYGTAYGNIVTLQTLISSCGMDVPYEGKTYQTIQIGSQCWLKQNLNVGAMIINSMEQVDNQVVEKYCYNNLESNCDIYGGLYQWGEACSYVVDDTTNGWIGTSTSLPAITPPSPVIGICPNGWMITTNSDWSSLSDSLGGDAVSGGKLKETGFIHWASPNSGATNSAGFTALPGGMRYADGGMFDLNYFGYFWTSNHFNASLAWSYSLSFYNDNLDSFTDNQSHGYSVRCVKRYYPLPDTLIVQNFTAPSFWTPCHKAYEVLITGGNNNYFLVPEGGAVNLNAGIKIRLLPGTQVEAGGYLSAKIVRNGQFCENNIITIQKPESTFPSQPEPTLNNDPDHIFTVYPNPGQGDFKLKISAGMEDDNVMFKVIDLRGKEIISDRISTRLIHTFSLAEFPAGVYYVRIVQRSKTAIRMVIKL